MRGCLKVGALLLCMAAFQLSASKNIIGRVDIDLELTDAPEVEHRKATEMPVKVGSVSRWLMIRIEYTTDKEGVREPSLKKNRDGYTLQLNGFVDDLGVQVKVLQDTGLMTSGRTIYGMYTGETSFYSVRRDGKKHLVVMFVPGKLLDRFSRAPNGQISAAAKNDFLVEAVFTIAGRNVARAYYGCNAKAFNDALRMVPVNMVFKGGVFPRSRTPWALFGADDFDVEKELPVGRN